MIASEDIDGATFGKFAFLLTVGIIVSMFSSKEAQVRAGCCGRNEDFRDVGIRISTLQVKSETA